MESTKKKVTKKKATEKKAEKPEKKNPIILVRTHPNGYGVEVEGEGFMYRSVAGLIDGLLTHAGMEREGEMTKAQMKKYLTALKSSTLAKELQHEVNQLRGTIASLKFKNRMLREEIKKLEEDKHYY